MLDVDRCYEVCRRVGLEPCVALKVYLDDATHCLADVGDGDVVGVYVFGVAVAMTPSNRASCSPCCLASSRKAIQTLRQRRY